MKRTFRGSVYRITVRTGAAEHEVRVDGKAQRSDLVPAFADGREHTVEVKLARAAGTRVTGR